jgi:hypothetical protein
MSLTGTTWARVWLAALWVLALCPREAVACECGTGGLPCENAFSVDAVFMGTAREVSTRQTADSPFRRQVAVVVFTVERAFRGVQDAVVEVSTGIGGGDCGYAFKSGERYVVYAYRTNDGRLGTGTCTRTRLVSQAAEDLTFLGQLSSPAVSGHVFGKVTHRNRDLAFGQSKTWPVPFVHLLLRGPAAARDAQTDEHGRYDISGVPPGVYELQAIPPGVFSARDLRRRIEIRHPLACATANFDVKYDGRISGVALTSDGQPAAAVQVELVSGDALWISERLTTKSDRDGRFEFGELSPGRYGIGVSLRRTIEPPILYPKTLYPGTPSETYAAILELGEGAHLQLEPLPLPPARQSRELTGTVVSPDGRPVSGASVSLTDGDIREHFVAISTRTDSGGRFRFTVHDGLSYMVRALYIVQSGAETQRFEASDSTFVASEVLPAPRLVLLPVAGR